MLFDGEHLLARREHRVELFGRQLGHARPLPAGGDAWHGSRCGRRRFHPGNITQAVRCVEDAPDEIGQKSCGEIQTSR